MRTKKMFLFFAAFLFAAVAGYNIHLAQSNQNSDLSLADIAVMAQADGEATIECHQFVEWGRCNQCWHKPFLMCEWHGNMNWYCCLF